MKTKIAKTLRAWAQKLDPVKPPPPLEVEKPYYIYMDKTMTELRFKAEYYRGEFEHLPISEKEMKLRIKKQMALKAADALMDVIEIRYGNGGIFELNGAVYIPNSK